MDENIVQTTQPKKKKKTAKIVLIVLSCIFFLAAAIIPVVVFTTKKSGVRTEEMEVGNFLMRHVIDGDNEYYEVVRYIGSKDTAEEYDPDDYLDYVPNDDLYIVKVPADVNGVPVTTILSGAFDASVRGINAEIDIIEIETKETAGGALMGVSTIESDAFYGCTNLVKFEVPETVEKIGSSAFANSGLTTLVVYDASTLSFEDGALSGATQLTALDIKGASNGFVSTDMNIGSDTIERVEISGDNVHVGVGAFNELSRLHTLSVYNYSNLIIDDSNLGDSSQITTLNIYHAEDNLTYEFMSKFSTLSASLTTINIDSGINVLESNALSHFPRLQYVTFEEGSTVDLNVLGNNSFAGQIFYMFDAVENDEVATTATEQSDLYAIAFTNSTGKSTLSNRS